jgi:hypothetical protein
MMLPLAKVWSGRALGLGALAGAALGVLALDAMAASQILMRAPVRAPAAWTSGCAAQMEAARARLGADTPELAASEVRVTESASTASVELALPPQYAARIAYERADAPSVFDWEEAPTPVVGSFALHRRVGHYDLTIVADDSDLRGLKFAAVLQPVLDECVMETR